MRGLRIEDSAYPRRVRESRQLIPLRSLRMGEKIATKIRLVGGSFLKKTPLTFALNAHH